MYRRLSSLPDKPINIFNSIVGIFGNSAETEYAVYWQARELVDKYKADNGQAISDPTPNISTKGNAIYYFKEAVRLGDKKSAIKQLAKYIAEGGTRESYDASLATLHPLGNIAKSQRDEFYQGLSDSEKRTVDRAIALYERIILEGEEVASSQLEGTTGKQTGAERDLS